MKREDSSSTPVIVGSGKFTFQDPAGMRVGLPNDSRNRQSVRSKCQNSNRFRFLSVSVSPTVDPCERDGCPSASPGFPSTEKYPKALAIVQAWPSIFQATSLLQASSDIDTWY